MKQGVHAFTLVEVSLALMVVAIGILAILGLYPAGLGQAEWSSVETHAAFFAEEVFNGIRALVEEDDFEGFDDISLPGAAADMWDNPIEDVKCYGGANAPVVTNIYAYGSITQHAFRYTLTATNINDNGNLTAVFLSVWPGEFGGTNYPMVFYTEFYRFKPQ